MAQRVHHNAARLIARIAGHEELSREELSLVSTTDSLVEHGDGVLASAYKTAAGLHDITDDEHARLAVVRKAAADSIRFISNHTYEKPELASTVRTRVKRVVVSGIVGAENLGRAHAIARSHGPDALVSKYAATGCPLCKSLHAFPDGRLRTFKLSELPVIARGVGIGPAHPGCMCKLGLAPDLLYRSSATVVGQHADRGPSGTLGAALLGGSAGAVAQPGETVMSTFIDEVRETVAETHIEPLYMNPDALFLQNKVEKPSQPVAESMLANLADNHDPEVIETNKQTMETRKDAIMEARMRGSPNVLP